MTSNQVDKWPLVQFNSWGYGTDISEDKMMKALDTSKMLGLEAFVLDFGWQDTLADGTPCLGDAHTPPASSMLLHAQMLHCCAGNWTADSKKFPNGLKPLAAAVHNVCDPVAYSLC